MLLTIRQNAYICFPSTQLFSIVHLMKMIIRKNPIYRNSVLLRCNPWDRHQAPISSQTGVRSAWGTAGGMVGGYQGATRSVLRLFFVCSSSCGPTCAQGAAIGEAQMLGNQIVARKTYRGMILQRYTKKSIYARTHEFFDKKKKTGRCRASI